LVRARVESPAPCHGSPSGRPVLLWGTMRPRRCRRSRGSSGSTGSRRKCSAGRQGFGQARRRPRSLSRAACNPHRMLLSDLVRASADVAATSSRLGKIGRLATSLRALDHDEVRTGVAYLAGVVPGAATGIGWASLRDAPPPGEPPSTLHVRDVAAALDRIRALSGPGSRTARSHELAGLFAASTEPEQPFLRALLSGELRQGALE